MRVEPSTNPDGYVVHFEVPNGSTHRYILTKPEGFMTINPFGEAEDCPVFETFDDALESLMKEVHG